MPNQFQRPKNLPNNIPIFHTVYRDSNADLLLKITALDSDKTVRTAAFPVFKEDMVEYLPNFFGTIFDENKGYNYKENRLQKDEYFEIGIPNLKYRSSFAMYLYNFVYTKIPMIQDLSGNHSPGLDDEFDQKRWRDFYWIANYFGEDDVVDKVTEVLSKKYKDFLGKYDSYFGSPSKKGKRISLNKSINILSMVEIFMNSSERSVIKDNLCTIAKLTKDYKYKKTDSYIEAIIQAVIDAGIVPHLAQILEEYCETADNKDIMEPCLESIANLMAGTTSQTKTVLEQKTILPSILRIIRNFEMPDITRSSLFDSIRTDVYWIIGEIACHTDQIDSLLDSKVMPAVIKRFGLYPYTENDEQVEAAQAIDNFISCGTYPQIVQILSGDPEVGDDLIRYIFQILGDEYMAPEWFDSSMPNSILEILSILKNLLIKHEKNQQLIKSTMIIGEQKEITAAKYDLFKKIEWHNGIIKIKKLQYLEQEKITGATVELLDLYSRMKEKAESEKKVEVVDQKMKKVSVNSNQNTGNGVLPRRMMLRSSKRKNPMNQN